MPRKKRETKVSQKQKAVQAQAVKQTVKVVVGETKKAKRPYRRRAKPSQPAPVQQPVITPFPQVIQLPPQQSPFAMFNPEQFSRAIGDQINQRLAERPVLAEAMVIPQEGRIVMTEPEQQPPSIAMSMMSPVAKAELENIDEELRRKVESFENVSARQAAEIRKARESQRPPSPRPSVLSSSSSSRASTPEAVPTRLAAPKRIRPKPSKATLEQEYFELTGDYPPNMKYEEIRKEVSRVRRAPGTKMPA